MLWRVGSDDNGSEKLIVLLEDKGADVRTEDGCGALLLVGKADVDGITTVVEVTDDTSLLWLECAALDEMNRGGMDSEETSSGIDDVSPALLLEEAGATEDVGLGMLVEAAPLEDTTSCEDTTDGTTGDDAADDDSTPIDDDGAPDVGEADVVEREDGRSCADVETPRIVLDGGAAEGEDCVLRTYSTEEDEKTTVTLDVCSGMLGSGLERADDSSMALLERAPDEAADVVLDGGCGLERGGGEGSIVGELGIELGELGIERVGDVG